MRERICLGSDVSVRHNEKRIWTARSYGMREEKREKRSMVDGERREEKRREERR